MNSEIRAYQVLTTTHLHISTVSSRFAALALHHSHSSTYVVLFMNNRSFVSMSLTVSCLVQFLLSISLFHFIFFPLFFSSLAPCARLRWLESVFEHIIIWNNWRHVCVWYAVWVVSTQGSGSDGDSGHGGAVISTVAPAVQPPVKSHR